ncbi:hypothetical protein HYH03_018209, partial [Edaphochlamys debaryana]
SGAPGSTKALTPSPVPAGLAGRPAPFTGPGPGPVYDKGWPFQWWLGRKCMDLLVEPSRGSDDQDHNYESAYAPFRSVAAAVAAANMCDRVLLAGGASHKGPVGFFQPNITLMTDPADLGSKGRATLLCTSTGDTPCVRTGEGLYGGAAALTITDINIVMSPPPAEIYGPAASKSGSGYSYAPCLMLNEGSGGGWSSFWDFWVASSGRRDRGNTLIKNVGMFNCTTHGIKISTFVRRVVMEGLYINATGGTGVEVRGGVDLTLRSSVIANTADTGVRMGGGARNVLVERNIIRNFGDRGILLGSDQTEVEYMDVDWALGPGGSWHDCVNATVRNNLVAGGAGAGIAWYSARDATVVQNTFVGVAATQQAAVLLDVSPKALSQTLEVGPPNTNIVFRGNIVQLAAGPPGASVPDSQLRTLVVESRLLEGSSPNQPLAPWLPAGSCSRRQATATTTFSTTAFSTASSGLGRRSLQSADAAVLGADSGAGEAEGLEGEGEGGASGLRRRGRSLAQSARGFAGSALYAPGETTRNPDGSCPWFPPDNHWHRDVSAMSVHPQSDAILARAGGGNVHNDYGGHDRINGQEVLYGIPITYVDSSAPGFQRVPVTYGPDGYWDESDVPDGTPVPLPPDAPVEGTYPGCREPPCGGDRHVLVVDRATCTLYETYRSFPPSVTGTGRWRVDQLSTFNLTRNAQPQRRLGWTSADAAGLAIAPGLVKYDELINKGVIDHAIRYTLPYSRAAYGNPATHFAPRGDQDNVATLPYMGMRIRIRASYDCASLGRLAQIFCTAMKRYGGILADNGSPWYFTGEAHKGWEAHQRELSEIEDIPSSAFEVLDTGCLCLSDTCSVAECDGVQGVDPVAIPTYPAVTDMSQLKFDNNIYATAKPNAAKCRFVDRRGAGKGFDGGIADWRSFSGGDKASIAEADPQLDPARDFAPSGPSSPAVGMCSVLPNALEDLTGKNRGSVGSRTDAGALLYGSVGTGPAPTPIPSPSPSPSPAPSTKPKRSPKPGKTPKPSPSPKPSKSPKPGKSPKPKRTPKPKAG